MKNLAMVCGSIAAVVFVTCARAHADEATLEVPQAQLACMGLAGLQPITDAAGNEVRGNWDPGEFGAIGIPLGGGGRLVVQLNWSYQPGVSDLAARILCHLLATGQYPEPIPPGPRDF